MTPTRKHTPHAGNAPHTAKRERVQALLAKGLSLAEIGAICGVSKQAIHQLLKRVKAQRT